MAHLISPIKLLVLDVDGVLTDGSIYYSSSGDELKKFNVRDGIAIQKLLTAGIKVALLSSGLGKSKAIVWQRAKTLGIQLVYVGTQPKEKILEKWRKQLKLEYNHIAYIGDDVNDLGVFQKVGLSACPADAAEKVKQTAQIVLSKKGGEGCVREFVEKCLIAI